MKHPILYRIVFYSAFVILVAGFLALLHVMSGAPFKSSDMGLAYQAGCQYGSRPLDDSKIQDCYNQSSMFEETLDVLDKQMEQILESRQSQ